MGLFGQSGSGGIHRDRVKLATYLGAQTYHRFRSKKRISEPGKERRAQLILLAIILLVLALLGVWYEVYGF